VKKPNGADHDLKDRARSFRNAYGVSPGALLLIRPDGYVAQIATKDGADAILAAASLMAPVARAPASIGHAQGGAQRRVS
jgi:hypothetical protein